MVIGRTPDTKNVGIKKSLPITIRRLLIYCGVGVPMVIGRTTDTKTMGIKKAFVYEGF
jgi:hypothetical protein